MMRIEDRIEEIVYYRTDDGETFNTYEKARKHVVKKAVEDIVAHDLLAFTEDWQQVFPADIDERMDDVFYFSVRTEKALEFMQQVFEDYDYDYPLEELGDYRYDKDFDEWRNKANEYQELDEKWRILGLMV